MYPGWIEPAIAWGFGLLCVAIPLAVWKLIDIAIWLFRHVSIGWA